MKNYLTLFIALACFNWYSCQSQTTEKEYLYCLKGYKDDLAMGKDMIAGYTFQKVYTRKIGDYSCTGYWLTETAAGKVKCILVTVLSGVTKQTHYVSIPIANDDLQVKFYDQVQTFTEPLGEAFAVAMGDMYGRVMLAR